MNNKISLTFLITIIFSFSYAQEYLSIDTVHYTGLYSYTFLEDSTSRNSTRSQEMILHIGNNCSQFTAKHTIFSDSVLRAHANETPTAEGFQKIWAITGGTTIHIFNNNYVFKNYPKQGIVTFTGYLNRTQFKTVENSDFTWQISPDPDTLINGYTCKKATTEYAGRDYTAYFTMEIPISEGPYKFSGLPGLIVKVRDANNEHQYELTRFSKNNNIKPIIFKKYDFVETTPQNYLKALHVQIGKLYNTFQRGENVTMSSDETKARSLDNLKSCNNFIEKY